MGGFFWQRTGKGQIEVRIRQPGVRQSEVWIFLDRLLKEMLGLFEGIRFGKLVDKVKTPFEIGIVCRWVYSRGPANQSLLRWRELRANLPCYGFRHFAL